MPAIDTNSCVIDVMAVPTPYRIESFWLQVESCFERWRVVKAQVGAEPIYHSWFRHFPFSDYEGLEVSRYIWLLQQVVEGVDKFERTYMVKKRARVRAPLSARKQRSAREREFAFWKW